MNIDPAALVAGVRHIALETVGSTNAEALARARAGERGPLWITALTQTSGRGRRGSAWVSPPGNLYATLLLTEPSPAASAPQLAFVASLALNDALLACSAPTLGPALALKWPNDVLLKGRKVAGLLIEAENAPVFSVAIGIGANCVSHPDSTAYPATDLAANGATVTPALLFSALTHAMHSRLAQWRAGHGFAAVRASWLERAARLGETIEVRLPERDMRGRFSGLDESGRLLLEIAPGRTETVTAGEVFSLGTLER